MIISEEEAKEFYDLYQFETWCMDFLRSVKELRKPSPPDKDLQFARDVATYTGKVMLAKIPFMLREIDGTSGQITKKDFIDAFTKRSDDAGPMPREELLHRLDSALSTYSDGTPPTVMHVANTLRGALIRLAQSYGDPEVSTKVDMLIVKSLETTGI